MKLLRASPPTPIGLTPDPSPNGEGRDHRGYPYFAACFLIGVCCCLDPLCGLSLTLNIQHPTPTKANHQHLTLITQHPSEASPPAPLRMERGVITEIPLHVLCTPNRPSPSISSPKGVTSHTTPLSIRRGVGGEASVNSVCRRPSVGSKQCTKMLSELCALCERKKHPP